MTATIVIILIVCIVAALAPLGDSDNDITDGYD